MIWKGWITYSDNDADRAKEILDECGVEYSHPATYLHSVDFNECRLSEEAFHKLEPHWGEFVWGLTPGPEDGT